MLLSQSQCFSESPGILGVGIHWTNQMKLELGRQLPPGGSLPIWKKSHVFKSDRQNEKSKANFPSLLSFLILSAKPPGKYVSLQILNALLCLPAGCILHIFMVNVAKFLEKVFYSEIDEFTVFTS